MRSRRRGEVLGDDGTRIATHTHGDRPAGPVVVLTNGIGTTENFWRFLIDDLVVDHGVVHWDYRGHGSTEPARSGDYRLRTHAEDLARVTRAAMGPGGAPPVHIGFSMGVAVLLELYRAHPELVRAMVLISGAPDAPGVGTALFAVPGSLASIRRAAALLTPAVPLLAPLTQAFLRSSLADPVARALGLLQPHAPPQDIDQLLAGLAGMEPLAYWGSLRSLLEASASDVLPSVSVPVTIVAAIQDAMMPLSQIRRMRDMLPRATYVEIDDAGHAGLIEQGPQMVAAVRGLLARLPDAG